MSADPFGTQELSAAALQTWRSSPTRFREDANAEEDLVLGGYRDRWFVELAQNAADAAARAGAPGQLLVALHGRELRVANTGAPLDPAGVAALASLRASAKRETGSVGRFGIGFAAVLTVSEEPAVLSHAGGVRFSAVRTRELVAAEPALRAEADLRGGRVPVLRLVWPTEPDLGAPPDSYHTEVRLPLLPEVDGAALLDDAAAQAADLLLALPALHLIEVAGHRYQRTDVAADGAATVLLSTPDGVTRWRLVRRHGELPVELLTAAEERHRPQWSVCWAVPVSATGAVRPVVDDVLHAPTPTDERLSLPVRLLAGLPVEPSRRRLQPGPAARYVLDQAVAAYPELVHALDVSHRLALVPAAGFPRSDVDSVLHEGVVAALREATWLPAAASPPAPAELSPAAACALDPVAPALAELMADLVPGLLAAELSEPSASAALVVLGIPRLGLAEVVAATSGVARPPSWWRRLYEALTPLVDADPAARESLAALPVPLADGRTVTGPRTTVVLDGAAAADLPGLRVVHPAAVHPLLVRLGARPSGPRELLTDPQLRDSVQRSVDDAEAGLEVAPLVDTVLALVSAAELPVGLEAEPGLSWLGALALPASDGEIRRADELVLPDGAVRPLLAEDGPLGVLSAAVAGAWPREVLRAVGVLDGFAVLVDEDPVAPDHDLADEETWWDSLDVPPARLTAIRDLDLVADQAWPAALRLLATQPDTAQALRDPYSRWWLARNVRLAGHQPRFWRLDSAVELAGLYDPVPARLGLDDGLLALAGVRGELSVTDLREATDLLTRLADPGRTPTPAAVRAAHAALTVAAGRLDLDRLRLPSAVRAVSAAVVDAADACVLDLPWLWGVAELDRVVAGGDPAVLADLLDLPLASEVLTAEVVSTGRATSWQALPEVAAVCESLGRAVPAGEIVLHERLCVRTADGVSHEVPWWWADGVVHAADPVRAVPYLMP